MNCEKCHELVSDFLDGTLIGENQALFSKHLEDCLSCANVREDINAIVSVARQVNEYDTAPPNERALWLRIRNTIESERGAEQSAARASVASAPVRESLWSRWMNKRLELSLPQLAATVSMIVVTVALATAFGLQGLRSSSAEPFGTGLADSRATGAGVVSPNPDGLTLDAVLEDRVGQQKMNIDYWKQRIEHRKTRWNPRMRDTFERNMSVIDQAVEDSLMELKRNPHDAVSEEMLNAALREKMELLREFSEL